jgi:hypothetical protein
VREFVGFLRKTRLGFTNDIKYENAISTFGDDELSVTEEFDAGMFE